MDKEEVIRYVGRGTLLRAQDHGVLDENPDFREAVEVSGNLTPIVCSFKNGDEAEAVESALIHVLSDYPQAKLTNRRLDKYKFAPLGVPPELWRRGTEKSVTRREIADLVGGSFVAVYVGAKELAGGQRGIINALKPEADAIADRTLGLWAFGTAAEKWKSDGTTRPLALVAITGGTKRRYITASVDLRKFDYESIVTRGEKGNPISLVAFDVSGFENDVGTDAELDAFELRGRLVADLKFAQAPQTRRWVDQSGREHDHSPFRQWAENHGEKKINSTDLE